MKELVKESNRSLISSLSCAVTNSLSSFSVLASASSSRVPASSAERPFPITSKIAENPLRILCSSSASNLPAPFAGPGLSVRTARLSGARGGNVKCCPTKGVGEGGIAVMVGVVESAPDGRSGNRPCEGESERGESSGGRTAA